MVNELDMAATEHIQSGMQALIVRRSVELTDWTCIISLERWADGFTRYTFQDKANPQDSAVAMSWQAAREIEDVYL